jgi:hypothetical protein
VAPFSAPVNGLNTYTRREAIRGGFNKYWHSEHVFNIRQVLGHSILSPPKCPSPTLYKCSLTVDQKRSHGVAALAPRRRCLQPQGLLPVTAAYKQRSALSETRSPVQSRRFARRRVKEALSSIWSAIRLSITFHYYDAARWQVSIAPMRTVHIDAYSRKGASGLYYLNLGTLLPAPSRDEFD